LSTRRTSRASSRRETASASSRRKPRCSRTVPHRSSRSARKERLTSPRKEHSLLLNIRTHEARFVLVSCSIGGLYALSFFEGCDRVLGWNHLRLGDARDHGNLSERRVCYGG